MEARNCWWYQGGVGYRQTVTGIAVLHMLNLLMSCLIDFDCKDPFRQLCKIAILAKLVYDEISFSSCFYLLHNIFVATYR